MNVNETSLTTPAQKSCWYRITPERLIWAVIFLEIIFWLSERFRWFAFNESKGLAVLLALSVLGLAILWFSLWYVSALLYRRHFQFGIRTLLVLMIAVAIPFSWLATEINRAKREQKIVESFVTKFEIETKVWISASNGLTRILGDYFFYGRPFFLHVGEPI